MLRTGKYIGWYRNLEEMHDKQMSKRFLEDKDFTKETLYINPMSLKHHFGQTPKIYKKVQFDPVWSCNQKCSYCNAKPDKTPEPLDIGKFKNFLVESVGGALRFNVGCGMEPLLFPDINKVLEIISEFAPHKYIFGIQTNGILLENLNFRTVNRCHVNLLSLSLDTVNPKTLYRLRPGVNLNKLIKDVENLLFHCPEVKLRIVIVATLLNFNELLDSIDFLIRFGASIITLRQVILMNESQAYLKVADGDFYYLTEKILDKYGSEIEIEVYDNKTIQFHSENTNRGGWDVKTWASV